MSLIISMAAFALVASITPGPVNIVALSSGAQFGFRASQRHVAGAHFDHFLGRDQDITEALLHLVTHDAIAQSLRNRLFEARIGVNDVPTLHRFLLIDPGTTGSLSESQSQIRPAAS